MDAYIKYNDELRLAICAICQVGLSATNPMRHFRRRHLETWKVHKKGIARHVEGWDLAAIHDLVHPEGMREPVEGLKVVSGWCCETEDCMVASVSEEYMEKHCRATHGWSTRSKEKNWFACQLQSLLGHPYIRYNQIIIYG
jgi:hypothetical protein